MPGGQSHNARFYEPYPFYADRASGKYIWDVDGNRYTDYWMGHTALIMGHSPSLVVRAINSQSRNGLLFGSPNKYAYELASLVNRSVPCAESIRFCTTGAEATMYAVRLARAFTKRKTVVKMRGGWHGYNSALTVGVTPPFNTPESRGMIDTEEQFVSLAEFNDIEATRKVLTNLKDDLACVIIEPVMGSGGVLPARSEYLRFLREECDRLGAVLIFDEIITGFRLALGGAQEFFGIKPDLCTLGKILGGGLPVSAVAGESEILSLADTTTRSKAERCWIGGGTFSENALCLRAGIATLNYLLNNKASVYPRIGRLGVGTQSFRGQGIRRPRDQSKVDRTRLAFCYTLPCGGAGRDRRPDPGCQLQSRSGASVLLRPHFQIWNLLHPRPHRSNLHGPHESRYQESRKGVGRTCSRICGRAKER